MSNQNGNNKGRVNFEEYSKLVDEIQNEGDNTASQDSSVALARLQPKDIKNFEAKTAHIGYEDLTFENLQPLVVENSHLLPASTSKQFDALILNAPFGSYSFRIGSLKSLDSNERRRLSRSLRIYNSNAIKFVVLDGMLFDMLSREAYAARNLIKVSTRKNQQQTRSNRYWGGKKPDPAETAKRRVEQRDESTIESFAGERLDISNLASYFEILKKMDADEFDENEIDNFSYVKFLLQDFIQSGGSDLHLHASRLGGRVRYRYQGTVYTRFSGIPLSRFREIVSSICTLGAKDPTRMKRDTVDTVIKLTINLEEEIKDVEFRFASMPSLYCPSINLRGQTKPLRDITKVGFTNEQLEQIFEVVENDRGIVIVTGATGSGKTNSLNCIFAILEQWNEEDDERVILELGNPIEIESERRVQIPIVEAPSEKLTDIIYQKLFKATMRFDPDVIAFTEIRSADEARIAFRAASTGHLVFTTMHAADAEETLSRLFEMGIDRSFIAKGVLGIVAQTLVKKLCEHCRIEDKEASAMSAPGATIYTADEFGNCPHCADSRHQGYKGQTVIAEVLIFNKEIQQMISEGFKPAEIISRCVEKQYLKPLKKIALEKSQAGITSESEISRIVGLRTEINAEADDIPVFDDLEVFNLPVQEGEFEDLGTK